MLFTISSNSLRACCYVSTKITAQNKETTQRKNLMDAIDVLVFIEFHVVAIHGHHKNDGGDILKTERE